MYLHGDGGSKIFFSDGLDRQNIAEETLSPELKSEREELKKILVDEKIKFDIAITNPPFAMPYKKAEADQKRILEQYELAYSKDTHKLKSSLKSNVMFIQRYHDLLKDHGKLITIIDESVLNTETGKDCRDFIYENFLVRAIISLPRMTFVRAGANVKTSILYLEKKKDKKEEQPHTFFARCDNSGFDYRNLSKIDPDSSDLKEILHRFKEYMRSGKL
jgi:type I restriction enzyme M protein